MQSRQTRDARVSRLPCSVWRVNCRSDIPWPQTAPSNIEWPHIVGFHGDGMSTQSLSTGSNVSGSERFPGFRGANASNLLASQANSVAPHPRSVSLSQSYWKRRQQGRDGDQERGDSDKVSKDEPVTEQVARSVTKAVAHASQTSREPTTAESVALVNGMDTLIGHQVHAFDRDTWEKTMALSFAWDFTYWYSFVKGSEAWQYTDNPYTDRNPTNPYVIEQKLPKGGVSESGVPTYHDRALAIDHDSVENGGIEVHLQPTNSANVKIHHDDGVYGSIDQWYYGEHIPWNIAYPHTVFTAVVGFILAGENSSVMCLYYAQAWFVKPFKGISNLPTKEFARFLERETKSGAQGARRKYWLQKFEDEKYGKGKTEPCHQPTGCLVVHESGAESKVAKIAEPESNVAEKAQGFLSSQENRAHNAGSGADQGPPSITDTEYDSLISTLQSRLEPGQDDEKVLPLLLTLVDLDFYTTGFLKPHSEQDPMLRILYNMCIGDLNAMLVQTGRRFLHSAVPALHSRFANALPEGHWENPRSMSGDPTPVTEFIDDRQTQRNKKVMARLVDKILGLTESGKGFSAWDSFYADDFAEDGLFYGNPYTLGRASNKDQLSLLLRGVFGVFANRRLELVNHEGKPFDTVICQGPICGISGFLVGTMAKGDSWLGLTNHQDEKEVRTHFALFLNLHDDVHPETFEVVATKIKDAYLQLHLPATAMQLGLDMVKAGQEMI